MGWLSFLEGKGNYTSRREGRFAAAIWNTLLPLVTSEESPCRSEERWLREGEWQMCVEERVDKALGIEVMYRVLPKARPEG